MILIISLVIICLLYKILEWLYNKYKDDLNEIDNHTVHTQRRIIELEKKVLTLESLVTWLYKEIEKGDKND